MHLLVANSWGVTLEKYAGMVDIALVVFSLLC